MDPFSSCRASPLACSLLSLLLLLLAALSLFSAGSSSGSSAELLLHQAVPASASSSSSSARSALLDVCSSSPAVPFSQRRASWVNSSSLPSFSGHLLEPLTDAAVRLLLSGCDMDRVALPFFEECLRGRHLLFLGDSLTRFQYLSLVQFLALKEWTPFHGKHAPLSEVEGFRWGSWASFLAGTSERLQGLEVCDCFREGYQPMVENRYFYSPSLNLRISFVALLGAKGSTRYHDLDFLNVKCGAGCACAQQGCAPGSCDTLNAELSYGSGQAHMVGAALGAVRQLAQLAPLDAVFLNVGFHGGPGVGCYSAAEAGARDETKLALQQLAAQLVQSGLSRAWVWKSTTAHKGNDYNSELELDWVRQELLPLGWQLFDAYELSWGLRELEGTFSRDDGNSRRDTIHYGPAGYRGLNEALAVALCSGPEALLQGAPLQPAAPVCRLQP
jgi:hypothetical protein